MSITIFDPILFDPALFDVTGATGGLSLQGLIDLTRSLAGDLKFEGNSDAWGDDEIVMALNWAQKRYAELTHCTYREVAAIGTTDAGGVFIIPAGFILVDRVLVPDQVLFGPNATITAPATAVHNTLISVSVPLQAGATYFWTVAGGTLTTGQGTNAITFTGMNLAGALATVGCLVFLGGLVDSGFSDVALT